MSDSNKRFDESWSVVDCNDCANYWNDTCDGVPQGSERPCNSFLATRSVVIPSQLKSLKKAIRTLNAHVAFTWLWVAILYLILWGIL